MLMTSSRLLAEEVAVFACAAGCFIMSVSLVRNGVGSLHERLRREPSLHRPYRACRHRTTRTPMAITGRTFPGDLATRRPTCRGRRPAKQEHGGRTYAGS